jgi:glyoxylase I family protein
MLYVDHVVFPAWHAKKSLEFYQDVMGFALSATFSGPDWGGYPWLMMIFTPGDGREIVLVALRGATPPKQDGFAKDVRHLAFAEKSLTSLREWRRRLQAKGIAFTEESHGSQRSLYFEDPNGMVLEITAPPSKPGARTRQAALKAAQNWLADAEA